MLRAFVLSFVVVSMLAAPVLAQEWRDSRYDSGTRAHIEALGSSPVLQLPIPIYGVSLASLTNNFGDPRGDGTRTHEGLDIMAPQDAPIASPTDAVVTRTGNGSGSGLYVRTSNPGGESFVYMHLSRIAAGVSEGVALKRGDIIGFVGNTGNASGGAPHLHFEIRSDRSAIDPFSRITSVFSAVENDRIVSAARSEGVTVGTAAVSTNGSTYLEEGDSGAKVVQMQQFLIAKRAGPAASRLASAGATGYFGPVTVAALREYQASVSTPVMGYVDAATNQLIFAAAGEGDSDAIFDDNGTVPTSAPTAVPTAFKRDLERGMEGEDVRVLQILLNTHGFAVAKTGVGSPGNETAYFGAATQAALVRFQKARSITPAAGYFGPKTRAAISAL